MPESLLPSNTSLRSIKYVSSNSLNRASVAAAVYPDTAPAQPAADASTRDPTTPGGEQEAEAVNQAAEETAEPTPSPLQPAQQDRLATVIAPPTQPAPKPPVEICLECMMRDKDMADVDVSPSVWQRKSDGEVAKALALWSAQEQNALPLSARTGLKPQDEVTEEALAKWTTINPPVSNYRVMNLKAYVADQVSRNNVNATIDKTLDKILKCPSTSSLAPTQKSSQEPAVQVRRRRLSESSASNVNRTSKQNLAISLANAPPLPVDAANQITNYEKTKAKAGRPLTVANDLQVPAATMRSSSQLEMPPCSPQSTAASPTTPTSPHSPHARRPFSLFFKQSNRSAATSLASGQPSGSMVDMHIGLEKEGHQNKARASSVNGMEVYQRTNANGSANASTRSLNKSVNNDDGKHSKKKKGGIRGLWNRIRGKSTSHVQPPPSQSIRSMTASPSLDDRQREGSLMELQQQAEKEDMSSPLPPPPSMSFLSGEPVDVPNAPKAQPPHIPNSDSNGSLPRNRSSSFELEYSRSSSSNLQKHVDDKRKSFISMGSGASAKNIPTSTYT